MHKVGWRILFYAPNLAHTSVYVPSDSPSRAGGAHAIRIDGHEPRRRHYTRRVARLGAIVRSARLEWRWAPFRSGGCDWRTAQHQLGRSRSRPESVRTVCQLDDSRV